VDFRDRARVERRDVLVTLDPRADRACDGLHLDARVTVERRRVVAAFLHGIVHLLSSVVE
jgi:hypothetical protein